MTRALSFGYNAAAALAEVVVARLIKALFEDGTVSPTMASTISLGSGVSATATILISKPSVELVVPNHPDRGALSVDLKVVLQLAAGPALAVNSGDWLTFRVTIRPRFAVQNDVLAPDMASLTAAHIVVGQVKSNNALLAGLAPPFLGGQLQSILGASDLTKLSVPFGLDKTGVLADAYDIRMADGPLPLDRDEAVFAAYSSQNPGVTRGQADSITTMLEAGRSLTVRLSQATFSTLLKEQLDFAYMRFDVTLGDSAAEQKYGISWGPAGITSFGVVVGADWRRANLRNVKVTNLRTNASVTFSTDDKGAGANTLLFVDLKSGDTLRFYGQYRYEQNEQETDIYYPTFTLKDGYIELAVHAVRDVLCYDEVDIDLTLKLYLSIDPATGKLDVKAADPDVDLPWYVDAGVFIVKALVAVVTGPYSGLLFGDMESKITGSGQKAAQEEMGGLLPSLLPSKYMRVFWESIEVKSTGLVIAGQVESGWLAGGGVHVGTSLTIDMSGKEYQQLVVSTSQAQAWLVRWDPDYQVTDNTSRLILVNKSQTFEAVDADKVKALAGSASGPDVGLPPETALAGTVLGVKTAWGKMVKVRLDKSTSGAWVMRWISYNLAAEGSKVEITGAWQSDMKVGKSQHIIWYEVHKWWGAFGLKLTNFYEASGLKIEWTYAGPGVFKVVSSGQRKITVEVDADAQPGQNFKGTLKVKVEDVFGRKASASIDLHGHKSWGEPGPELTPLVSPEEIERFGPGPVSLPVTMVELVALLERRIGELEAKIEAMTAR